MVNQEQNNNLTAMPDLEELKEVVFSMNCNSAIRPDEMNGYFIQKCWHIIRHDLLGVIQAFFCGQMIPKYFSHSCIILLPKVSNPNKLTNFMPSRLSNFTFWFCQRKKYIKNIMLAQEIIHPIKKQNIGSNVIIKLDMAKAYDRVSWSYIFLVLRRMEFDEVFIDMVWRIMANISYFITVNGKRHGFFHSTRGLKQGTNNQGEIRAAVFGMTWLLQLGYMNVILEVDSQLLVDWIMVKAKPPWTIKTQLQQIQELIRQTSNFRCKHILREANFVADSLSKHSHKIRSPQIYCNTQHLPKETRAYYQLDMLGMTSFRRRKTKRIKEPP
ncbi:hypothetical protein MTR67_039023 [Solanum verrucosum]|uniref:RNase H type-1 domain-containing protein n=1 Tax=Solanum verrucosum TaxID=315347 RepID=A0AAF0UG70_SOLVR|nr:hypothetical protein MTR67_039023 [Solanum verrucosum]